MKERKLRAVFYFQSPEICEEAMDTSVKIARTLIEAGCDVSLPAVNGKTPVSLALEMVN